MGADRSTTATIVVGGEEIKNLTGFSYTSDVLQLGDPASIEVPNPRGEWNGRLLVGSKVEMFLVNPDIANGSKTPKMTGLVVERRDSTKAGRGTIVTLGCADRGWHLTHSTAPVGLNLLGVNLESLAQACIRPHESIAKVQDPGWGFPPNINGENSVNRNLRINNKRAEKQHELTPLATFFIRVEPGELTSDVLLRYASKENALVNVSAKGELQIWRPDYSQPALYRLECHKPKTKDALRNNVIDAELVQSLDPVFTEVDLYGEVVRAFMNEEARKDIPHPGRFHAHWPRPPVSPLALDFARLHSTSDGEVMSKSVAREHARWIYERGLFDAWTYTATVRGHGQQGKWFESDTIVDVNDTVRGVKGLYYCSAVTCGRNMTDGDTTVMTLKPIGLLAAEGPYSPPKSDKKKGKGVAVKGTR